MPLKSGTLISHFPFRLNLGPSVSRPLPECRSYPVSLSIFFFSPEAQGKPDRSALKSFWRDRSVCVLTSRPSSSRFPLVNSSALVNVPLTSVLTLRFPAFPVSFPLPRGFLQAPPASKLNKSGHPFYSPAIELPQQQAAPSSPFWLPQRFFRAKTISRPARQTWFPQSQRFSDWFKFGRETWFFFFFLRPNQSISSDPAVFPT